MVPDAPAPPWTSSKPVRATVGAWMKIPPPARRDGIATEGIHFARDRDAQEGTEFDRATTTAAR